MLKGKHRVVSAAIGQAFIQPDRKGAVGVWRHAADELRPGRQKLVTLMDESEADGLAETSGRVKVRVAPVVNPPIWNRACFVGSPPSSRVKAASEKAPLMSGPQVPVLPLKISIESALASMAVQPSSGA